jgi:hypothetical protein
LEEEYRRKEGWRHGTDKIKEEGGKRRRYERNHSLWNFSGLLTLVSK